MPRKKKLTETHDINNITAICKILGYSEVTLMHFAMFKGLPMEFVDGNWRAHRKDIVKWKKERE